MKLRKTDKSVNWLKNKTVIGIACIIFALAVCFLITPVYNRQLDSKTEVVEVTKPISRGQQITKEMVRVVEVGSYNLPTENNGYVTVLEDVVGKYAQDNLYEGEYVLENRLREKPLANDEYLEGFDGSKGAISVTVQSLAAGLSGKLFAGDIVSVIATDDEKTYVPDELKYVKVLACTLSDGEDVDENTRSKKEEDGSSSDTADTAETITLLADKYQANRLADLEANQKIHIELVYRGNEENSNKFLKQQEKIIKEMKEDTADEQ